MVKKVKYSSIQAPDDIEKACSSVVDSMTKQLKCLSPLSRQCCINRVPERLWCVRKKAYIPQVVSIGPVYHGDKGLLYMEEHKQRYLQHFLQRTRVDLEAYVKKIMAQEAKLRGCYDGEASAFKSEVLVRIVLVDAAFIIELLLRNFSQPSEDDNDWIFTKPWMLQNIAPDMILLENQLPFFILEDLFADVKSKWEKDETLPSIIKLSYEFFQKTVHLQGDEDNLKNIIISSRPEVKHFVDLIRTLHLPSWKRSQTENPLKSTLNTPCAKKLHQAGVKFQVSPRKNLFDISFDINKGILEIPKVEIHDYTELTLRNLLAFEQCHYMENHISDYLRIMDGFVNTPMDVDLLVDNGIVVNTLGDNKKVSDLINELCVGVSWNNENYYFADLSKKLNNYCGKPWNKSKASLKQKYFDTPWAMISVFAAGFLIILTIIQTVCTIISVIN